MGFFQSISVSYWKPSTWLRVAGSDASIFLQGQFSNDLRVIPSVPGIYGLWLNQKGKVVADSFIGQLAAGEFWIGSYFCPGAEVKTRLEDYVIADDVEITDVSSSWAGVSLIGPESGAWLRRETRLGVQFPGRRTRDENWEWVFPSSELAAVRAQLDGARELNAGELDRLRIEGGIPAVPMDIGLGDLPAEGGLDAVAISYNKGCYLGQEVMARLKSMGKVRRRLRRVRGEGPPPSLPAKLSQDQKPLGEIRSAAVQGNGFVGLAMVSLINLKENVPVHLDESDGRTVEILPESP